VILLELPTILAAPGFARGDCPRKKTHPSHGDDRLEPCSGGQASNLAKVNGLGIGKITPTKR